MKVSTIKLEKLPQKREPLEKTNKELALKICKVAAISIGICGLGVAFIGGFGFSCIPLFVTGLLVVPPSLSAVVILTVLLFQRTHKDFRTNNSPFLEIKEILSKKPLPEICEYETVYENLEVKTFYKADFKDYDLYEFANSLQVDFNRQIYIFSRKETFKLQCVEISNISSIKLQDRINYILQETTNYVEELDLNDYLKIELEKLILIYQTQRTQNYLISPFHLLSFDRKLYPISPTREKSVNFSFDKEQREFIIVVKIPQTIRITDSLSKELDVISTVKYKINEKNTAWNLVDVNWTLDETPKEEEKIKEEEILRMFDKPKDQTIPSQTSQVFPAGA